MEKILKSFLTEGWEEYPRGRVFKRHPSGFLVIKPRRDVQVVPLECPICDFLMSTQEDASSFRQAGCCNRCRIRWADGTTKEKRWKEGWRPSDEEIKVEIQQRGWRPSLD